MNLMADTMTSPTAYMQAYFRQRGWRLPEETLTIPNVMPAFQKQPLGLNPLEDIRQGLHQPADTSFCGHPSQGPVIYALQELSVGLAYCMGAPVQFKVGQGALIWHGHVSRRRCPAGGSGG